MTERDWEAAERYLHEVDGKYHSEGEWILVRVEERVENPNYPGPGQMKFTHRPVSWPSEWREGLYLNVLDAMMWMDLGRIARGWAPSSSSGIDGALRFPTKRLADGTRKLHGGLRHSVAMKVTDERLQPFREAQQRAREAYNVSQAKAKARKVGTKKKAVASGTNQMSPAEAKRYRDRLRAKVTAGQSVNIATEFLTAHSNPMERYGLTRPHLPQRVQFRMGRSGMFVNVHFDITVPSEYTYYRMWVPVGMVEELR